MNRQQLEEEPVFCTNCKHFHALDEACHYVIARHGYWVYVADCKCIEDIK